MIISICGDEKYKNILINEFKERYQNNVVICDYFQIKFNSIIETESIKYKLMDSSSSLDIARMEYGKVVNDYTNRSIDKFMDDNKNKIIILTNDNVLTKDFYSTSYFNNSDIKVLVKGVNIDDINCDDCLFDVVIKSEKDLDIRKLVKK